MASFGFVPSHLVVLAPAGDAPASAPALRGRRGSRVALCPHAARELHAQSAQPVDSDAPAERGPEHRHATAWERARASASGFQRFGAAFTAALLLGVVAVSPFPSRTRPTLSDVPSELPFESHVGTPARETRSRVLRVSRTHRQRSQRSPRGSAVEHQSGTRSADNAAVAVGLRGDEAGSSLAAREKDAPYTQARSWFDGFKPPQPREPPSTPSSPPKLQIIPFGKKQAPETPEQEATPGGLESIGMQAKKKARQNSSFVTAAVNAVGPSVVRIDTERTVSSVTGLEPLLDDPVFKRFFGDDLMKQMPRERTERGQGSGFFITRDGLLVTNAHVVQNAEKVTITLTDGRSFTGVVKGTDDLLDLAVVKVDSRGVDLPVAHLGVSSELQVGDWVIALGNPLGLDNTVTLGIVSSLNRSAAEVGIPEKRLNFIQTDAAINPGNSGGPLVNEFGEVVGINTAIRANAEGIGFAIPIDRAKDITGELAQGKKIQHSYVGIQMVSLTPEFARQNNEDPNAPVIIPEIDGAIVIRVLPNSPAAEAGVRRFDIIQMVDGITVKNAKDVQAYVDKAKVGQLVQIRMVRGSKSIELAVTTGDLSEAKQKDDRGLKGLVP
ncbi:putative serine protease HhoA [Porphyridium purpureum]|uniref:Putative serine protease HhoA n=1 Tax=Porphyridium purpureum TaxID=35688 RepID=A0A5J4YNP9_PORPP|nr:putative serine protease HhoA [Porphyridium purpureum]|eukprot:POR0841..scf249_10